MANIKLVSAAAVGLLLASGAAATAETRHDWNGWHNGGTRSYSIDRREYNQARSIEQGRRAGSLTQGEYWRLKTEQARIAEMERRAKADGHISRYERQRIDQAQDAASRHIRHERTDGQASWWRRNWW